MTKLTDTQLIVLSSAAKHDDGLAVRPANLNTAAAAKVASSLINKRLMREIRAKADAPVWHEPVWHEKEDGRFALKITRAGREAIGVDDQETQDVPPAPIDAVPVKSKKGGSTRTKKPDAEPPRRIKVGSTIVREYAGARDDVFVMRVSDPSP